MNIQIIYSMLSRVLAASGAALLLPLLLSLYERGPILPFLVPMLLSAALSLFLKRKGAAIESSLTPREGTAISALCAPLLGEREPLSLGQPGREHLRPHRDRRDRIS